MQIGLAVRCGGGATSFSHDDSSDVRWHMTNQVREGYSTGTVNAGGHTRAFHLALIDSDTILPPSQRDRSANNVLESQREKFHLPMDHQEMMN